MLLLSHKPVTTVRFKPLLIYIRFLNHMQPSLQQILRRLQLNLFERKALLALLKVDPPEPPVPPIKLPWYSRECLWDSSDLQ